MSDELTASDLAFPCAHVVGAGQLCGQPSLPGRARCQEHATLVDARAAHQVLEAARQRVLLRFEERADELADTLMSIVRDPEIPASSRLEGLHAAFKILGLDKVEVSVTHGDTPQRADRDRRLLELMEKAGASNQAAAVRGALGIVEATAVEA